MTSEWLKLTAYLNNGLLYLTRTLRGDKVIMLTYAYSNKPLRKIKVVVCICQADSPLNVWPDV